LLKLIAFPINCESNSISDIFIFFLQETQNLNEVMRNNESFEETFLNDNQ
jgi:hypothetical protein